MALTGLGFFVVESNGELYLSRSGQWSVNAEGILVNASGAHIMGEQGTLYVDAADLTVKPDGTLVSGDHELGKVLLVDVDDATTLTPAPNNTFLYTSLLQDPPTQTQFLQGFLESSNVDVASETISLIEMMRLFEMQQKLIRANDDMLGTGITTLGEF